MNCDMNGLTRIRVSCCYWCGVFIPKIFNSPSDNLVVISVNGMSIIYKVSREFIIQSCYKDFFNPQTIITLQWYSTIPTIEHKILFKWKRNTE